MSAYSHDLAMLAGATTAVVGACVVQASKTLNGRPENETDSVRENETSSTCYDNTLHGQKPKIMSH